MTTKSVEVLLSVGNLGTFTGQMRTAGGSVESFGRSAVAADGGFKQMLSGLESSRGGFKNMVQDLEDSNSKLDRFGKELTSKGKSWSLAVTAPLALIGAKAISTAADFEKSMNTMGAVAGVPGPELEKLSALAIKLGADTVFSANEAAEGMLELSKSGISTADIMGGALKNALDLATAGGLSLADASTVTANAMNVFGLSGRESKQAVDALAGAANASSADVSDLTLALSQSGLAAANAKLTIQDTTATLAAFADAGLKGSDAGTSLKTMLLNLVPTTKKQKEMMDELGISFVNADGSFKSITEIAGVLQTKLAGLSDSQRTVALETIFGSDAIRAATVLYREGAAGLQEYIKQTSESGVAAEVAAAKMEGLPGVIERLKGSIDTGLKTAGDALAPIFTVAAEAVGGFITVLSDLPAPLQTAVVGLGLVAAAAGPAMFVSGKLIAVWGQLSNAAGLLGLNLLRAQNQVGGMTGAVGGMVAKFGLVTIVIDSVIKAITHFSEQQRKGTVAAGEMAEAIAQSAKSPEEAIKKLNAAIKANQQEMDKAKDTVGLWSAENLKGIFTLDGTTKKQEEALDASIRLKAGTELLTGALAEQKKIQKEQAEERKEQLDVITLKVGENAAAQVQAAMLSKEANEAVGKSIESVMDAFSSEMDIVSWWSKNAQGATDAGAKISEFYQTTTDSLNTFMGNVGTLMKANLDPAVVMRLLEAGPAAAGPLVQAMVSGNTENIVRMVNDGEKALQAITIRATEMARLTAIAVQSTSNQFSKELPNAMRISELEIQGFNIEQIADRLGITLQKAKEIATVFGIEFGSVIGKANSDIDSLNGREAKPVLTAEDEEIRRKMASAGFGLNELGGKTATPKINADDRSLNSIIQAGHAKLSGIGAQQPTPKINGNASDLNSKVASSQSALNNIGSRTVFPRIDTQSNTESKVASAFNSLRSIAGTVVTTFIDTVRRFINEDGGYYPAEVRAFAGGTEDHRAQIASAGAMRLWAEPETGGEAYIPLASSKRAGSTTILGMVAKDFGFALTPTNMVSFALGGYSKHGIAWRPDTPANAQWAANQGLGEDYFTTGPKGAGVDFSYGPPAGSGGRSGQAGSSASGRAGSSGSSSNSGSSGASGSSSRGSATGYSRDGVAWRPDTVASANWAIEHGLPEDYFSVGPKGANVDFSYGPSASGSSGAGRSGQAGSSASGWAGMSGSGKQLQEDDPGWNPQTMGNGTGIMNGRYFVSGREVSQADYFRLVPGASIYRPAGPLSETIGGNATSGRGQDGSAGNSSRGGSSGSNGASSAGAPGASGRGSSVVGGSGSRGANGISGTAGSSGTAGPSVRYAAPGLPQTASTPAWMPKLLDARARANTAREEALNRAEAARQIGVAVREAVASKKQALTIERLELKGILDFRDKDVATRQVVATLTEAIRSYDQENS